MATQETVERVTSTDHIFQDLYARIMSLDLLPGTKLSETEVAKSFGYSRQPVREAFTRLANLNLLLLRPIWTMSFTACFVWQPVDHLRLT